jgi:hypothetical protein
MVLFSLIPMNEWGAELFLPIVHFTHTFYDRACNSDKARTKVRRFSADRE